MLGGLFFSNLVTRRVIFAAARSSWCLDQQTVLVGCGNCVVLRDRVLAEGGATAFVAVAFFDLVLFAGGLVYYGGAACEDDCRGACWRLDAVLMAGLGGCG